MEWQTEQELPRGSKQIDNSGILTCLGASLLILYKLRSEAKANAAKVGIASDGRGKTDPQEVWFPILFTLPACIVS